NWASTAFVFTGFSRNITQHIYDIKAIIIITYYHLCQILETISALLVENQCVLRRESDRSS
ncbi:hypothetical protein, partial [Bacteroides nordii]